MAMYDRIPQEYLKASAVLLLSSDEHHCFLNSRRDSVLKGEIRVRGSFGFHSARTQLERTNYNGKKGQKTKRNGQLGGRLNQY